MSVAIADLFVNLGIKGSEKTVGAIADVKKGMGEVKSMSLEAKAAIVGVIYGLYSMTEASSKFGTAILNNSLLLGTSVKNLQQYIYAGRQFGATSEEIIGSMKALDSITSNISIGKGLPEGAKVIAQTIGSLDVNKLRGVSPEMRKDVLIQYLQKFAKSNAVPNDVKNWALGSFGISGTVAAGMQRGGFDPKILAAAPLYNEGQIKGLDKARNAWANSFADIEMAYGKLNARYGVGLAQTIEKLANGILKLVQALVQLESKTKAFEKLGMLAEGLAEHIMPKNLGNAAQLKDMGIWQIPMVNPPEEEGTFSKYARNGLHSVFGAPPAITINQNQNITHYGDAKDTNAVKQTHGAAAKEAQKGAQKVIYGSPTQTQGN